ncbi:hypothetical protein CW674_08610 [Macrococcoides caseolyticum]|uniref:oligosaccharide flippase family protein n=1 Tax=Macrococcoides caseolyticum TaxID=69966 RepID=UPI000C336838|nr:polysaccharide biosynthesis C-terminal domain-containing protein [Macrococcus caseolyticus]PKE65096.1 hypothetical protein CW674_08610 [Macrococcus caseolyticus]
MTNRLLKDTLIFALGNIFSKMTILLLLPFHTRILSATQIGTVDLAITTITILITLLTLNYIEGFLRFNYSDNINIKNKVYTNSFIIVLLSNLVFISFIMASSIFINFTIPIFILCMLFFIQSIHQLSKQYTRLSSVKLYALGDIIFSVSFIGFNIAGLYFVKPSINVYLLSLIIAYLTEWIILFLILRQYKKLKVTYIDFNVVKKIIIFSTPLILNALLWWMMNISDKYMLSIIIGLHASGIYVIASKFTALINMFYSFFYNAWQIKLYNDDNDYIYINRITNIIFSILALLIILIINFNSAIIDILFGLNFHEVKMMLPWMTISVLFSCMSSMIGITYLINMENKYSMFSSLICGSINIVLNFLFISNLGVSGAALSTMFAFIIMFYYRVIDVKKRYHIFYDIKLLTIITVLILLLVFNLMFNEDDIYLKVFLNTVSLIFIAKNIMTNRLT